MATTKMMRPAWLAARATLVATVAVAVSACSDTADPGDGVATNLECSIPQSQILPGGPGQDGIPALTDPEMVAPDAAGAAYLGDDARVIGLTVGDQAYAVPVNIMWWHEIVNLNFDGLQLAVTHCPLTGSSMAFDRAVVDGAEFGVSGLLYLNNLIMYDRTTSESLWPQMVRGARCGSRDGTDLDMYPVVEMTWLRWRRLHPGTRVISDNTGHSRDYNSYPYGDYDDLNNSSTLFAMPPIDTRRPPKERVLGVPEGDGGVAYPFGVLEDAGVRLAIHDRVGGREIVVLWFQGSRSAMAFEPLIDGQRLTFDVVDDQIVDSETGSVWSEDGYAVEGPLAGTRLPTVQEAFVAYWFAWEAFYGETTIWEQG